MGFCLMQAGQRRKARETVTWKGGENVLRLTPLYYGMTIK